MNRAPRTGPGILSLLYLDTTSATRYRIVDVDLAANQDNLFMYTLPDNALRLIGYTSFAVDTSVQYRFCSVVNCGKNPEPKPIWEQIWNGIVATVAGWVVSAVVLAINAFAKLGEILLQLGNWVADMVSGDPVRVARAVQAAAKVVSQFVDAVLSVFRLAFDGLINLLQTVMKPLFRGLANSANNLLYASDAASPNGDLDYSRTVADSGFNAALAGFALALAELGGIMSTISALLLAVEVGYTIAQATGIGFAINLAVQAAIYAAFLVLGDPIQKGITEAITQLIVPNLPIAACTMAVVGVIVALLSWASPGAWTSMAGTVTIHTGQGPWTFEKSPLLAQRNYLEYPGSGTAIVFAVMSLVMIGVKAMLNSLGLDRPVHRMLAVALDALGLVKAAFSVTKALKSPPIALGNIARVLSFIAVGTSSVSLTADLMAG